MTKFSNEAIKPDKTDRPDKIQNHEFLEVMYGDLPDNIRGMIVSSKGNPNLKAKGFWNAKTFGEDAVMPDDHNNFLRCHHSHLMKKVSIEDRRNSFQRCMH